MNADFGIKAHPEIFLLDRKGRLARTFIGVVSNQTLGTAIDGLLR